MIKTFLLNNIKQLDNLTVLALVTLFARMAVPEFRYVFFLFFIYLVIMYFFSFEPKGCFKRLAVFVNKHLIFVIALMFYFVGIVLSQKVYTKTIIELMNGISIFIILFIKDEQKIKEYYFSCLFSKLMAYSSLIISVVSVAILFSSYDLGTGLTTSLITDSNFYSLFILIGFLSNIKIIKENNINIVAGNIFLFIQFVNILLVGSRRGFVIMLVILLVFNLFLIIKKIDVRKYLLFITASIIYVFLITFFLFQPAEIKRNMLPISTNKYNKFKAYSCSLIESYSSFFPKKILFHQAYNKLYSYNEIVLDSPEYWTNRVFYEVLIDSIKAKDTTLINKRGVLINSEANYEQYGKEHIYYINLPKIDIDSNNMCLYTIYCFVSGGFTGNKVVLYNAKNKEYHKFNYDLNKKGTWQKLYLRLSKPSLNDRPVFFVLKTGEGWLTTNDDDYILISNFDYKVINYKKEVLNKPKLDPYIWASNKYRRVLLKAPQDSILPQNTIGALYDKNSLNDTWSGNAYMYSNMGGVFLEKEDELDISVYCKVSEDFNGEWAKIYVKGLNRESEAYYDMKKKGEWQKLNLTYVAERQDTLNVFNYFAKYNTTNLQNLEGNVIFAAPCYIKDSKKQSGMKVKIGKSPYLTVPMIYSNITKIKDRDFNRLNRWEYAWEIWQNKYTLKNKLFGHGFDYLGWYGEKFHNDKNSLDYPHNPIVSAFLYSGILGGMFYVLLLLLSAFLHIKNSNNYIKYLFFIILFFSFFSGNSFLSIPIFLFFTILPLNKIKIN